MEGTSLLWAHRYESAQTTKNLESSVTRHDAIRRTFYEKILADAYEYIVYLKGRVKDLEGRLSNTGGIEEAARKLYALLPYDDEAPEESESEWFFLLVK